MSNRIEFKVKTEQGEESIALWVLQVPIIAWNGVLWARVSSAIYNSTEDFERLGAAIMSIQQASGGTPNATNTAGPKAPKNKDMRVFQSTDSDTSHGIPEVNKSVKDFYGCATCCRYRALNCVIIDAPSSRSYAHRVTRVVIGAIL